MTGPRIESDALLSCLEAALGPPFFARYGDRRPLRPGHFETRRDLSNLTPLLVHVRLFGGAYLASVEPTLARLGCSRS